MTVDKKHSPKVDTRAENGHNVPSRVHPDGALRQERRKLNESFTVTVIIATRNRPELLRRALRSVEKQTIPVLETLVVFDQSTPDHGLVEEFPAANVRVIANTRAPGLAGARNSGIGEAKGQWIGLCDDDDAWADDKLERQKEMIDNDPTVDFVVGGITIAYGDRRVTRNTELTSITFDDLLRDRVMEAHPSTFLVRARAIADYIGLVDEELPGSYGEDYDWLLRATRIKPIAVSPATVALIQWHTNSYYTNKWPMIDRALGFLLEKTPEFDRDPRGKARIMGQRAFAQAAMGDRREAFASVKETMRLDWREPRLVLTLLVASKLVSAERLVRWANSAGRGI